MKQLISLGWKVCQGTEEARKSSGKGKKKDEEAEAEELVSEPFSVDPDLHVLCKSSEVKEKATQPPKAYTEGTLLKAMESAGKQLENEELREVMKDAGLGTPATRAATIERLKKVGYITMQGKRITVTPKGRTAVELIRHAGVELLTSPEMTGQWERRLHQISKGEAAGEKFMENVKKFTVSIIEKVRSQPKASASLFEGEAKPSGRSRTGGSRLSTGSAGTRTGKGKVSEDSSNQGKASAPAERVPLGACPRSGCGGQLIEGKKGYGCTHFKQGCGFVIWKEYSSKKISHNMLASLIEKGQTQLLSFKDGDLEYKARIVLLDKEKGQLQLERSE
ncbi:DNA topoisomerase 3 [compost metagenome]